MQNQQVNGALTGMLVAAAANWAKYDDETQRRLRNIRNDAEAALDEIRNLQSRGELIRLRIPVVQDFQVGLALASPALITPQLTPAVVPMIRPNLTSITPSAIADLQWPPVVGSYDPNGMTSQPGDMTVLSLALSYEEVRAFILGMTQSSAPQPTTKTQIYNAASGLVQALAHMGSTKPLTIAEYATIWLMLFQGTAVGPGGPGSSPIDPHTSTALPPVATSLHANAAITPLGKPEIPAYPYEHQNTDRASKWRIVITGAVPALTSIATFKFGTVFTRNGKPFQPSVSISDGRFHVTSLLPDKFTLEAFVALSNETIDLNFTVSGGD
jgi:hypothetical protein